MKDSFIRREYKQNLFRAFETIRKKISGQKVIVKLAFKVDWYVNNLPEDWAISEVVCGLPLQEQADINYHPDISDAIMRKCRSYSICFFIGSCIR